MSSTERDLQHSVATLGRIQIVNENWRGKTDPAERRRIQNRLNQRAFRERQRAVSSSESDPDSAPCSPRPQPVRSISTPTTSSQPLDELGQTINRNVLQAVVSNCAHLPIPLAVLRSQPQILTPQPTSSCPASLLPTKLQHIIPHDPFLDAIPHPRFRANCLKALANKSFDATRLGTSLRRSGTPAGRGREGLIVWGDPEEITNWELTDSFVAICSAAGLLEGCEDWVEATNWWRGQRGEGALRVR